MKHGKSSPESHRDEDKKIWHMYAKGVKRIEDHHCVVIKLSQH
jgi:hypothetical protein